MKRLMALLLICALLTACGTSPSSSQSTAAAQSEIVASSEAQSISATPSIPNAAFEIATLSNLGLDFGVITISDVKATLADEFSVTEISGESRTVTLSKGTAEENAENFTLLRVDFTIHDADRQEHAKAISNSSEDELARGLAMVYLGNVSLQNAIYTAENTSLNPNYANSDYVGIHYPNEVGYAVINTYAFCTAMSSDTELCFSFIVPVQRNADSYVWHYNGLDETLAYPLTIV